jgi:GMP synthase (glutamine-hydrolysing)
MQLQARFAGGSVGHAVRPERGLASIAIRDHGDLFRGLPAEIVVFQDHGDEVTELPEGFRVLASNEACTVQAIADPDRRWWGTQFHPEWSDDDHPDGDRVLRNFFALARESG